MNSQRFGSLVSLVLLSVLPGCGGNSSPAPAASPGPSAPSARAELDPAKVVFAMRGSEADFRKCFMRSITSRGIVRTSILLDQAGRVEEVQVPTATIGESGVAECLKERLAERRFGDFQEPMRAEWTFVFRLSDPVAADEFEKRLEAELGRDPSDGVSIADDSRGSLDPVDIEQHVAVRYPLFARCYRDSISRLTVAGGILRLRFVIDEAGHVANVEDGGSVMPDSYAVDCVAEGFYAMTFPVPTGGPVSVNYRLDFD